MKGQQPPIDVSEILRVVNGESFDSARGRDPVNELLERSKFLRAVMLPSSAGMSPVRPEEARFNDMTFVRRPKFAGIAPPIPELEKSLESNIYEKSEKNEKVRRRSNKVTRLAKPLRKVGKPPAKRLPPRFKLVKFVIKPMLDGIVPESQLFAKLLSTQMKKPLSAKPTMETHRVVR